ncbi:hypothetical protein K525DRAFT_289506 [Schizophyllum commune Loenen D]|nr:hypothetical protein K525DRAFT_289506 [Schizophyllum commune Loenen D]
MPHQTNVHFGEEAEVIPPSPSGTRAAEVPPATPALAPTAALAPMRTAAPTPTHTAASMPDQAARVPTEARYAHIGVAYAPTQSEAEPSPSPSNAPGLAASNTPGSTAASNGPHRRRGYAQTPYHRPASIESDGEEVTAANIPPRPSAPVRPPPPVVGSSPSPSHSSSPSPSHGSTSSASHGSSSSSAHSSSPSPSQDTPRPSRPAQISEATPRLPTHTLVSSPQPTPRQPLQPHSYNVPPISSSDQSTSSTSSSSEVRIHGLLAYRPNREPGLDWDFAQPFDTIVKRATAARIDLNAPAIQSAGRFTDIDIVTPCGAVHVTPGDCGRVAPGTRSHILVIDVLRSLHDHFAAPAARAEYNTAVAKHGATRVDTNFYARCDAIPDAALRAQEIGRGVLHLDLLLKDTRFGGLLKRHSPVEWELRLRPRPAA